MNKMLHHPKQNPLNRSLFYILSFFYSSLLLSCAGANKQQPAIEPQNFAIDTVQIVEAEQEATPEETIYEEHFLEFFNPIGILGEGLINVEAYVKDKQEYIHIDKIMMYNDPECRDLYCSYELNRTDYLPKGKHIIPIYNKIDYGWYCFVCTGSNANSYKIAINQTERKYIKKDRNIRYYTWEGFFDAVFCVNPTEENPLREYPSDDAAIIDIYENDGVGDEPDDYYQEVKLKDEWLHVKYEKSGLEGWLRWRKDNDIIVEISISW